MSKKSIDYGNLKALVYDESTNDVLGEIGLMQRKRKIPVKDWMMFFHRGAELLAKDTDLTGQILRVLLYALSQIDFENRIIASQADICTALNLKQQRVSEAFRLLVKKGIFIEGKKYGTVKTYYLNTEYGWKGKATNLLKRAVEETQVEDVA